MALNILQSTIDWVRARLCAVFNRIVEETLVFGAGLAFGLGIAWFFSAPPSTTSLPSTLPGGFDPYVFIAPTLADAEREMNDTTKIVFEPPQLRMLRFCDGTQTVGTFRFENRPRGLEFADLILDRIGDCLDENREGPKATPTKIILSANTKSLRYVETERALGPGRGTESLYFCGCEKETITLLESNTYWP